MQISLEPLLPSMPDNELQDLALALVAKANRLAGSLDQNVQKSIGALVRSMNCYYSNLIEGHDTHPRDIDRALANDYSSDTKKRALQLEARAHIELQRLIDDGNDPDLAPSQQAYIVWLHKQFCEMLPDALLIVENPVTGEKKQVVPGQFRDGDVQVGRHVPPPANELAVYMKRFEQGYNPGNLNRIQQVIAVAASHHRLLWIHPFYDGNGRVARLMSHAMLIRANIGNCLWSISRGLARKSAEYKQKLEAADAPREGDLDGRGARSERRLVEFCKFFLSTCLDEIDFMETLIQPTELLRRIKLYVDDEAAAGRLPNRSFPILREAFLMGEVERGHAAELTGYQERRARQILSLLIQRGLLVSQSPRAPVRLGIPLDVVERWFPSLYPVGSGG